MPHHSIFRNPQGECSRPVSILALQGWLYTTQPDSAALFSRDPQKQPLLAAALKPAARAPEQALGHGCMSTRRHSPAVSQRAMPPPHKLSLSPNGQGRKEVKTEDKTAGPEIGGERAGTWRRAEEWPARAQVPSSLKRV